jgi:hypothetical protein
MSNSITNNWLLINCKTRKYSAFLNVALAICASLIIAIIWENFGFSWWYMLVLGIVWFQGVHSFITLQKGGWKIHLLVIDNDLLVTYKTSKFFQKKLDEIKSGEIYSKSYDLKQIENLWIRTVTLDHSLIANNLKIKYKGNEEHLIELEAKDVKLTDDDVNRIFTFILSHNSSIKNSVP